MPRVNRGVSPEEWENELAHLEARYSAQGPAASPSPADSGLADRVPDPSAAVPTTRSRLGALTFLLLMLAMVLVAVLAMGCNGKAPDQSVQLTIAADSLAASETLLVAADQAHLIPAADRAAVAQAVRVAQVDVAAARASLGQSAFDSALAQVAADVAELVKLRTKYPATAPAK